MPQQPQKPSSSTSRQRGFSLMELMIALMIIGVIATLGFKAYGKYSAKARYTKAQDTMKTVAEGLDQYYLKYGKYPDLGSFEAMVDANSPLVKQSMVPVNTPGKDMWDQPFEGKSTKATYELKCLGGSHRPGRPSPLHPGARQDRRGRHYRTERRGRRGDQVIDLTKLTPEGLRLEGSTERLELDGGSALRDLPLADLRHAFGQGCLPGYQGRGGHGVHLLPLPGPLRPAPEAGEPVPGQQGCRSGGPGAPMFSAARISTWSIFRSRNWTRRIWSRTSSSSRFP